MTATAGKNFLYASLAIGALGLVLVLAMGQSFAIIAGLFAGIGCAMGVVFWKYGYLVVPLITQRTRIVMMDSGGFEIPPSQDVILKNTGGVFYASSFLGLKIFESTTEKTMDENLNYTQYFERAISNLKYVTKISYLLFVEDVGEKRKLIETKRAEAMLRLQRERDKTDADSLKMDKFEREVAQWDAQLNRLIKGVKPMGIIAYAMTTAVGVSKEAAIAAAKSQASELRTVLANALNVEVVGLQGDEMLKCFEWERFYPTTPQELEESVI
ncbi:MAG: hypothetical protein ABII71_03325 [Candidatus Micrarchaeota archaeon]